MSVTIKARYLGDNAVELEHGPSGGKIRTDLPVDNGGKGRTFSPTDLFAASLSSCILTIMAGLAERIGVDLTGASLDVEKEMSSQSPRRVAKITGVLTLPPGVPADKRERLLSAVRACPVHRSLHPDIQVDVSVR
jgi:putative redox protein